MVELLAVALFAAVYAGVIARQLLGRGPGIWAIFLGGGLAMTLAGVLSPSQAEAAVTGSAPVLLFLFALFLFVSALDRAGAIEHLARWIVSRARHPGELPMVLFVGFGVLSGFLVNDGLVLLGVPLLLAVARRTGRPALPLLLTLAYAVTVGSVLTPLGNPQNLLVSLSSGLTAPITTFLRYLVVPTAVNLVLGAVYLRWAFRREMAAQGPVARRPRFPLIPTRGWGRRLRAHPVLLLFPATLVALLTVDAASAVTGSAAMPIYLVALGGAVALLLVSPGRRPVLREVDWSILLLVAGLFVVVAGAVAGGVIAPLTGLWPIPGPVAPVPSLLAITASSLGGPQVVSNVPWVALQIPVLRHLGYGASTPVAWVALAGASTLAGNVTLLGAASNLIIAERAEKAGVRIRLSDFVRHGLPLTALTVAVLLAALAAGL